MVASRVLTNFASSPFLLWDAVSDATPAPDVSTLVHQLQSGTDLRLLISYTGSLTAATLQLWLHAAGSPNGTIWYKGEAVDLDPTDGPISVDIPLGDPTRFHIQVESLTGTGTITILAYRVELGSGARRI